MTPYKNVCEYPKYKGIQIQMGSSVYMYKYRYNYNSTYWFLQILFLIISTASAPVSIGTVGPTMC